LTRQVEAAVTARVFDEPVWKRSYFAPQTMQPVVEYFWQNHLSIFRADWTRWPGKKLPDVLQIVANSDVCAGVIDEATFLPTSWPGFRVTGWAWDRESKRGPDKVILVNDGGVIVGVALGEFDRPDVVKAQIGVSRPDVGWVGYTRAEDSRALDAYLVREGETSVCKIASIQLKR
jgi:hypothetical protein